MKVLKFGGSSLQPLDIFLQCAQLSIDSLTSSHTTDTLNTDDSSTRSLIVVSALGGVTNLLQTLLDKAIAGENIDQSLADVKRLHIDRLSELATQFPEHNFTPCKSECSNKLGQLSLWLQGISLVQDANARTQAKVLSMGEYLSATLFAETMKALSKQHGQVIPIKTIDSKQYIKANGNALEAQVDDDASESLIANLHQLPERILVAPGFVASNKKDELTLLGRNGSDLSAAIFAAGLKSPELQIWSDVDGIFNADPSRVPQAKVIERLSYKEAMELSFFGAKVLHPKTIAPIASHKIPTRIKNSYQPDLPGTLITTDGSEHHPTVAGITMLDQLAMLNVSGVGLKGQAGLAERVFNCVSREKVSVVLISQSSSEYAISFCVLEKDVDRAADALNQEFALEIEHQQVDPLDIRRHLSSITVVGDGMRKTHGVAAKLFSALATANVNIVAIAQDSSERSISAVIRQKKADVALNKTYEYFFECPRVISVILYGVGTIGAELLNQIQQQQEELLSQRIDLRVIGIANSKQRLWQPQGLDVAAWSNTLSTATADPSIEALVNDIQHQRPLNPVFVDCSSSDALASQYLTLFKHGLHIVAANKKANTESIEYYQQLKKASHDALKQFGYETNVGAGLPIINHIKNQVRSGDKLLAFSGILSGSLSFIMGKLEDGLSFSEAVKEAKEKGFTEPDPRDDLSGMDVARKLLIIAREFGAQSELSDVKIEPLLSESLNAAPSIDAFMNELSTIDHSFSEKMQTAKSEGKVLRYAGTIDEHGEMEVKLLAVDSSHPLFAIRDGENAFSFSTRRYHPVPIVIRGYGAGAEVTAAGVFGDILQTIVA